MHKKTIFLFFDIDFIKFTFSDAENIENDSDFLLELCR